MARNNQGSSDRGFAKMARENPQKQRDIASMGGTVAHQRGTAHEFTSEEAREAGRKGGQVSGGNFARDRERASQAGREGGRRSRGGGRGRLRA